MLPFMTRKTAWILLLVVVLSILPYIQTLSMGFIYDDRPQIEQNPYLRLWPGFARVFTSGVWALTDVESDANYYRPLMWIAYNAVYSVTGASPWAFHLVNIVLHACVTAVVFLLTLELWKDLKIAGIAAALFALHPVHTEPVAWIAAVPDLGYTLFFLLALYFYVTDYKPALHATIACLMCYSTALLWKESALAFVPCVVVYDLIVVREFRLRRYVVLSVPTVAYLAMRTVALGGLAPSVVHEGLSVSTQILTAISNLGIYIEKLAVPVNLTFFYSLETTSRPDLRVLIVLLLFAIAAWKLRGRTAWSVLWVAITLLPVLAVSRVIVPLAERNLYLASVGFVWIAAEALVCLSTMRALVLASALCIGYFALDSLRVPVWKDELALFEQALQLRPDNISIRMHVVTELGRRSRYDEAITQLDVVLKQAPNHLKALTSKAGFLVLKKDWDAIDATCERAFELDPHSAVCHLDVGMADLNRERRDEAWKRFDRAFESNSRMWQALFQQGTMALDAGDLPTAVKKLEAAIALSPSAPAYTMLGAAYARMGEAHRATAALNEALRIDPEFELARRFLVSP
jgi:tetratricopeptide (TPR) repeat protein